MTRLLLALVLGAAALSTAALAANPVINCGSTYYVPLKQVDSTGAVSALPPGVVPVAQTADATKVTAAIGTMPGAATPAVVLKPIAAATGVMITVTAPALSPGSAAFNAVLPPPTAAIMLDIANMQSTTP